MKTCVPWPGVGHDDNAPVPASLRVGVVLHSGSESPIGELHPCLLLRCLDGIIMMALDELKSCCADVPTIFAMSLAASKLELESPKNDSIALPEAVEKREHEALQILTDTMRTGPVIAIDLDDVLSDTNKAVAECKSAIPARHLN